MHIRKFLAHPLFLSVLYYIVLLLSLYAVASVVGLFYDGSLPLLSNLLSLGALLLPTTISAIAIGIFYTCICKQKISIRTGFKLGLWSMLLPLIFVGFNFFLPWLTDEFPMDSFAISALFLFGIVCIAILISYILIAPFTSWICMRIFFSRQPK